MAQHACSPNAIADPKQCSLPPHSPSQNLRPKEPTLRPFDDLLIHALRRMVHQHCAGLVVDFCVYSCVADEVDDPFLAFGSREAEAEGEVPVYRLVREGTSKGMG